jgi:hypothetical protein
MLCLIDGSTDTAALTFPAIAYEAPAGGIACRDWESLLLLFGGTDAANETVNYQVVGWFGCQNTGIDATTKVFVPVLLAKGVVTLGAKAYGSGAGAKLGAAGNLWADTVTNTLTTSPRDALHSPADDSVAWLEVNVRGLEFVSVDVDLDSAASVDVFWQASKRNVYEL